MRRIIHGWAWRRDDDVVFGEDFTVGAFGADFEMLAAHRVEDERVSPGVEKIAAASMRG